MGFVRRIGTLYRTQVELLWRWRSGSWALVRRTFVALVDAAGASPGRHRSPLTGEPSWS